MRASVGVFFAIAIVNFIFAMGAHVLFDQAAPDYFGNPGKACYSMFRIFTIEGWNEIPDAIAVNATYATAVFARIYFGVAVVVGGILGLSIGNAVFVDQMMADNTHTVEREVALLTVEVRALRDELRMMRREAKSTELAR
jgi:voltage-gated sodium channel